MAEKNSSKLLSNPLNILCAHQESSLHHCPNKYSYDSLADPAKWIRLLTLHPASDDNIDAPLHARLWPVPRSEAPEFNPVSYTWGQEAPTSCMWVEDLDASEPARAALKCIPIRPNLEKLLKQLRRRKKQVPLWVDALCINQADHHEKGFQVRHMDEVYRHREVSIWLGDRSETSDVALDFIEEWVPFYNLYEKEKECREFEDIIRNTDMAHKWSALWDLIGRPWFSRRWIVQECVLSDHKHVFVGDRDFCWGYMTSLVDVMESTNQDFGLRKLSNMCDTPGCEKFHSLQDTPDRIESLKSLMEAYLILQGGGEAILPLEKLVDDFCGFFSQDPRDGIYAFLSLATDIKDSEWIPDYSPDNSVAQVYAQATRHIIRQTESLDIICRSNLMYHGRVGHGYSWIPWFGTATIDRDDGHSHVVHGYQKKSLTTFGQPLHAYGAAHRLRRCCNNLCDGCDAIILGLRHRCEICRDFDLCDGCFKSASTSHQPDHSFRQIPPRTAVYDASGGYEVNIGPELNFSGQGDSHHHMVLEARGWFVNTVSQVGPPIKTSRGSSGRKSFSMHWSSSFWEIDAVRPGAQSDGFFRALTGNRRIETVPGGNKYGNNTEEQVSCVTEEWLQAVKNSWRMMEGFVVENTDLNRQISNSLSVMASGSRRCAVIGKSVGFVPFITEPGDAVCIIAGCTVPVVLRKTELWTDGGWSLVGECYMDGLMEGEFIKEMQRSGHFVEPSSIPIV